MTDDYACWYDVTTRWNDNDTYGHLNNVVHHALMDTVVNTWLIENAGLDLLHGTMIGLVVEVHCEYKEQAGFPDTISVGLRVGELGSTSVRFEIAMRRSDGETFFEGHFVHAFIDRDTRETIPIEGRFKEALATLQVTS